MWRQGFRSRALVAQLFRDVPDALAEWRNAGIKCYIYSSGSREAQRQFFAHTQVRRRRWLRAAAEGRGGGGCQLHGGARPACRGRGRRPSPIEFKPARLSLQ